MRLRATLLPALLASALAGALTAPSPASAQVKMCARPADLGCTAAYNLCAVRTMPCTACETIRDMCVQCDTAVKGCDPAALTCTQLEKVCNMHAYGAQACADLASECESWFGLLP